MEIYTEKLKIQYGNTIFWGDMERKVISDIG